MPARQGEIGRAIKRTAIGIGAVIGLLAIVAILTDFPQAPGSARAAFEPPTPNLIQAKIEAAPISLDELFQENERRIRSAVDDRAKIIQSINLDEAPVNTEAKVAPSEERLLHNLPPKKVQEEPPAF